MPNLVLYIYLKSNARIITHTHMHTHGGLTNNNEMRNSYL